MFSVLVKYLFASRDNPGPKCRQNKSVHSSNIPAWLEYFMFMVVEGSYMRLI